MATGSAPRCPIAPLVAIALLAIVGCGRSDDTRLGPAASTAGRQTTPPQSQATESQATESPETESSAPEEGATGTDSTRQAGNGHGGPAKGEPGDSEETEPIYLVGYGSGLLVGADGIVVTSNHVIDDCRRLLAFWKGRRARAEVIIRSSSRDLALLKTELPNNSVARLKRHAALETGNAVWAIGFPQSFHQKTPAYHRGRISNPAPSSFRAGGTLPRASVELEMIPAISAGMSGGGIVARDGSVVAIITAINATFGNTGFGVKVDGIFDLADQVGVTLNDLQPASDARQVAVTVVCLRERSE